MANDMQWTDRDLMLQANKAHQEENERLGTENKLLRETVEELYGVLSNMDFSSQSLFKYDDMPWDKWCAVVYKKPIQLRLF